MRLVAANMPCIGVGPCGYLHRPALPSCSWSPRLRWSPPLLHSAMGPLSCCATAVAPACAAVASPLVVRHALLRHGSCFVSRCPAALPMVQLSAPLPICSCCLRGIVLVLCAVAPPRCRPPAAAHGRPLREPRRRAPTEPVRRSSSPMPRSRTGGIQKEGRLRDAEQLESKADLLTEP